MAVSEFFTDTLLFCMLFLKLKVCGSPLQCSLL
jgi:hypothetical protein